MSSNFAKLLEQKKMQSDAQSAAVASVERIIQNTVSAPKSNYAVVRNDDIRKSLEVAGMTDLINPDDSELTYVNSVFQSKGFHKIENVTYEAVQNIGKPEFEDLNRKMKEFTSKMGGVETAGIFGLIDDLSKSVAQSDLEEIWQKAVNAKPSLWARFLSLFDKSAGSKNLNDRFKSLQQTLSNKGKMLETKLTSIERDLSSQKKTQEENILNLEKAFKIYYNSFIELRKQYALIVYLEHSFKAQLDSFKAQHAGTNDLVINKELQEYEDRYNDIQNKRLIIHKSLLQLPIIVQQNTNLVGVIKTLMKEIDNTLVSSFPMIRGNLQTIGISIMTQKAMIGNDSAKNLEEGLSILANKVTGDLAIKGATLSAESRLREANTVHTLVEGLKNLRQQLDSAKDQSQQKMDEATSILNGATNELKNLLGGN